MQVAAAAKTNKIGDLQTAASGAVEDLLDNNIDPKNPRVRVAIVPYAEAVNIPAARLVRLPAADFERNGQHWADRGAAGDRREPACGWRIADWGHRRG